MPAPFSEAFRATLKKALEDGKDDRTIRQEYKVSSRKIKRMRELWQECGEVWVKSRKHGSGRPRKIQTEHEASLKQFLDANPDAYVRDMTYFLNTRFDIDVDDATVWRAVHRNGWITDKPKKPRDRTSKGFWIPGVEKDGETMPAQWAEPTEHKRKSGSKPKPKPEKKPKSTANTRLLDRTRDFVKRHMVPPRFDGSHDAGHNMRVERLAVHILRSEQASNPGVLYDPMVLQMAALMHDVEDHKYSLHTHYAPLPPPWPHTNGDTAQNTHAYRRPPPLAPPPQQTSPTSAPETPSSAQQRPAFPWPAGMAAPPSASSPAQLSTPHTSQAPETLPQDAPPQPPTQPTPSQPPLTIQQLALQDHLRALKCPPHLTHILTHIIPCISHSFGQANPERVAAIRHAHPELSILQDADRLDALGAIGISRAFSYGGHTNCSMRETFNHFGEKLERLEEGMWTAEARHIAVSRSQKLRGFREAWDDEARGGDFLPPLYDDNGNVIGTATLSLEPIEQERPEGSEGRIGSVSGKLGKPPRYLDGSNHGDTRSNVGEDRMQDNNSQDQPQYGNQQIPNDNTAQVNDQNPMEADPGAQLVAEMYGMR